MLGPQTYTGCQAPVRTEKWQSWTWEIPDDRKKPKETLGCISWRAPNGDHYLQVEDGRWFVCRKEQDGK